MNSSNDPMSVAFLVDDLATWVAQGRQPAGIQRVVSELLDTASRLPGIRPWPALLSEGIGPDRTPRLILIDAQSLGWERHQGPASLRLRSLRAGRAVAARLPIPRSIRDRMRSAYRDLEVRVGQIRQVNEPVAPEPDLLIVAGSFWMHAETPGRILRLGERGLRVRMIVHDLFPITNPEWVTPEVPAEFGLALDEILSVCDRIVVLSEYVAAAVRARYPRRSASVVLAVPTLAAHARKSGDPRLATAESPVRGEFILAVGAVEPRKNYRVILDAWALARRDGRLANVSLAIVGRRGRLAHDIEEEIARDSEKLGIRRIERANDDEVETLYRDCIATVHASWAEGFGLPARESVVRGIPTIMSSGIPADGLPEGTFRVFDPADAHALSELMADAVQAGHVRTPIDVSTGTGWEPVLHALVD